MAHETLSAGGRDASDDAAQTGCSSASTASEGMQTPAGFEPECPACGGAPLLRVQAVTQAVCDAAQLADEAVELTRVLYTKDGDPRVLVLEAVILRMRALCDGALRVFDASAEEVMQAAGLYPNGLDRHFPWPAQVAETTRMGGE